MKQKILAALQTKFTGVDDATLLRIAEKKAVGVTDESQITSIIEGVSLTDVLNSYGDYRANGAASSAVANYEKKHNLKDDKPIENSNLNSNPNSQSDDMAIIIVNAMNQVVKPLSERLTLTFSTNS